MDLLEREGALQQLRGLLADAAEGRGRVALVRGEAGIGKTSLVKEFVANIDDAHVLWGGCDDLMAARPLGPFWDMAFDEPSLHEALQSEERQDLFTAVLALLTRSLRPTLMVIEDVHWADESTLDLLKLVGRRIDRTHGLVVVTYRDGEAPGDHPLRVALGDLPHGQVERVQLQPLSRAGVKQLASEGLDADNLWELTGGNPFFVTEAIATAADGVPASIRDAVHARVLRLSADARRLVELASIAPSRIELDVVNSILGDASQAIAECEEAGILTLTGDSLMFRHELARRAVERDLTEITRRRLNSQALEACELGGYDLSRCAHHARESGDAEAIIRILPEAARRASELESHADALTTLQALEPYVELMSPEEQADHYDHRAHEEYLGSDRGLDLVEKAVSIRRELADREGLGNSLLLASRLAWVRTDRDLAMKYAREAVDVYEPTGGENLAHAYSVLSQLAMLEGDEQATFEWAHRALDIVGDAPSFVRAHALINLGSVRSHESNNDGLDELLESKRISADLGLIHEETRACVNIAWSYLLKRQLDEAGKWIEEAVKVVADAEMPSFQTYATAEKAWWHELKGEWTEATSLCESIFEDSASLMTAQSVGTMILAKLAVRRGRSEAPSLVADAVSRAETASEVQRLGPAYSVLAESHWLNGDADEAQLGRAVEVMSLCFEYSNSWFGSELGQWLLLTGNIDALPEKANEPYRMFAEGDKKGAAAWWQEHEVPYDRAIALAHGDIDDRLEALRILDELGAVAVAGRLRSELHAEGVKGVPRGPQQATRDHDLGLTARQADVLTLIAENLTNSEIADRLFISTRTVDHHVSAILAKLGASSRAEAAHMATEMATAI